MTVEQGSLSSRVLWPFIVAAQSLEVDLRWVRARVGLSEGQLRDPEVRIGHATAHELIALLGLAAGRSDFGLLAAREVERGHFDLLELALRSAPTLGEAIEYLTRFFSILDDSASLVLERGERESCLAFEPAPGTAPHRAYVEFLPAMLLLAARRETGDSDLRGRLICFAHPREGEHAVYEDLFKAKVVFDAERTVAYFDTANLALPFTRSNPDLQRAAVAAIAGDFRETGS